MTYRSKRLPLVVRPGQVWSILSTYVARDRQSSRIVSIDERGIAHCIRQGGRSDGMAHELRVSILSRGLRGARLEHEAPGFPEQPVHVTEPPRAARVRRATSERSAGELVKTRAPRGIGPTPRAMEALALLRTGLSTKEIAARMGVTTTVVTEYLKRAREGIRDDLHMAALKKAGS